MSAPPKSSKNGNLGKKIKRLLTSKATYRGSFSVIVALLIWELGTRYGLPIIKDIPPPSAVLAAFKEAFFDLPYYLSWADSFRRIFLGFILAQLIGIPLGLLMGTSRHFRELSLPVFEVLRPIPPLAWVPTSAIFWPTTEMSVIFVTFLGSFFVTILNIVGGARSIDARLHPGGRLPGGQPQGCFLGHRSSRHLAQYHGGYDGGHRHLLEHGGGGRDARQPLRPGISDLALLRDLHLPHDRGGHDQHRHRRLYFQRHCPDSGRPQHALAQDPMMPL